MDINKINEYFDKYKVELYFKKLEEEKLQIADILKNRIPFNKTIKDMLENQHEFMQNIIAENKLKVLQSQKDIE